MSVEWQPRTLLKRVCLVVVRSTQALKGHIGSGLDRELLRTTDRCVLLLGQSRQERSARAARNVSIQQLVATVFAAVLGASVLNMSCRLTALIRSSSAETSIVPS